MSYIKSPEWILVVLTAVYVGATIIYVVVSAKAFKLLQAQLKAAQDAAQAAGISASTAKGQLDIMLTIERPWVLASVGPLELSGMRLPEQDATGGLKVVEFYRAACTIRNYGKTPAWIESWDAEPAITDKDEPGPPPVIQAGTNRQVLPPGESHTKWVLFATAARDRAHRDEAFLYVLGNVSYGDFTGSGTHQTAFCFRYYPPFRDNRMQGFYLCGAPEYNQQT